MRLRNRIVKAEFYTDPDLLQWHRDKREFYRSLWAMAEDSYCIEDSPFGWKVTAWPSPLDDDMTTEQFAVWRDELIADGKLVPYEVDGRRYLFLPDMARHERPRNPQAPNLPLPEWVEWNPHTSDQRKGSYNVDTTIVQALYNDLTTVPALPCPVLSCPKPYSPKRSETEHQKHSISERLDGFDEFWKEQTRKEGKGAARKAYERALKKATPDVILAGWSRSKKAYAAQGRDRSLYPLPATWLNQERWDDDYTEPKEEVDW